MAVSRGKKKKVTWVVASPAAHRAQINGGYLCGFGMDVLSRGQFNSREKNAFPRGQGIRLNIQSPQTWCYCNTPMEKETTENPNVKT